VVLLLGLVFLGWVEFCVLDYLLIVVLRGLCVVGLCVVVFG